MAADFQSFNEKLQFNDLDNPDFVLGDVLEEHNLKSINRRCFVQPLFDDLEADIVAAPNIKTHCLHPEEDVPA